MDNLPKHLFYIKVSFENLYHVDWLHALDIMLEAPNGQRTILISDFSDGFGHTSMAEAHIDADAIVHLNTSKYNQGNHRYLPTNFRDSIDYFPMLGKYKELP